MKMVSKRDRRVAAVWIVFFVAMVVGLSGATTLMAQVSGEGDHQKTPTEPFVLSPPQGKEVKPPEEGNGAGGLSSSVKTSGEVTHLRLSLDDFLRLVRDKNEQIRYQEAEWVISRYAVRASKAIFEPAFVGGYLYQDEDRQNTIQELVSQGFLPEFKEKSDTYQAAIEALAPTGGRLRLGYTQRSFANSIDKKYNVEKETQTVFGLSFTQPLLKDGGIKATLANIRIARADEEIALQNYRSLIMRVLSEGIASYWDLYSAREKYRVRGESENNAAKILQDNIVRVKTGKMAETEVLEAEAGLAIRKAQVSEAKQGVVVTMNRLLTYISSSSGDQNTDVELTDEVQGDLAAESFQPDFAASMDKALKMRAEYLSSRRKIDREDIRLGFARNQSWPQLDLKGSYNLNGLANTAGHAWDVVERSDYASWSVGVELRVPLGGGIKGRSEREAVNQRKIQAINELKAVEVSIANTVDTAVKNMKNARDQVDYCARAVEMNRRLLEAEMEKFKVGKSNSRLLLEREEDLNNAREVHVESLVNFRKALLQIELAEGSLLINHGMEIRKAGAK